MLLFGARCSPRPNEKSRNASEEVMNKTHMKMFFGKKFIRCVNIIIRKIWNYGAREENMTRQLTMRNERRGREERKEVSEVGKREKSFCLRFVLSIPPFIFQPPLFALLFLIQ